MSSPKLEFGIERPPILTLALRGIQQVTTNGAALFSAMGTE